MKRAFSITAALILAACSNGSPAKKPQKAEFQKMDIAQRDTSAMYVGDDATGQLFYYALVPDSAPTGMLVLFPPNGQPARESASINASLATQARDSGLVTIVPAINHNLYLDEATLAGINAMLLDASRKFHVPADKIVFGGFSLGGMNAIRYTERSAEKPTETAIHPIAVYGIDPPLDWVRAYAKFEKSIRKNMSAGAVSEAMYFLDRLRQDFGGTPVTAPEAYARHSMFSANEPDGGNARVLKNIAVRIYSDPDTVWYRYNRGMSYEDLNAADGAAFIRLLQQSGNSRAEYVSALGKGYRPDGSRHPHSWSLAEPQECLSWAMRCIRGRK